MRIGARFCPGILNPVPAKDGLLVRIRIPGGIIEASQLKTIAELSRTSADNEIEITSRANLQLRGIQQRNVESLIHILAAAGLLPSDQHDRARNIVASPLAGIDSEELIDVSALVRDLDTRLQAETCFAELHPKFSFGLYGGGRRFSQDRDDLSLEAVTSSTGIRFRLFVAGQDSGCSVSIEESISGLLRLAETCIDLSKKASLPSRAKSIVALPDGMDRLLSAIEPILRRESTPFSKPAFSEALMGVQVSARAGYMTISPSVPLGRLTSKQAESLAAIAVDYKADLRLAPWRGIILGGIPEDLATSVIARLTVAGLSCSDQNGFRGIAACAGSVGCDASLADVRTHAIFLAERLRGIDLPKEWTVNLSGCDKRCARRHEAMAEMIAGESGYTLKIKGALVATDCSPEFALNEIVSLQQELVKRPLADELR